MQFEFFVFDGRSQVAGDGHAFDHLLIDLLGVEVVLVAPLFLGAIQRHVGLGQQPVGTGAGRAVAADADADRDPHIVAGQGVGRHQRIPDLGGQPCGLGRVTDIQLQDCELVTTQACDHIVFPHTGLDSACNLLQ
ncbi:hypothetical protein D3C85_1524990 [compost metagenome]